MHVVDYRLARQRQQQAKRDELGVVKVIDVSTSRAGFQIDGNRGLENSLETVKARVRVGLSGINDINAVFARRAKAVSKYKGCFKTVLDGAQAVLLEHPRIKALVGAAEVTDMRGVFRRHSVQETDQIYLF